MITVNENCAIIAENTPRPERYRYINPQHWRVMVGQIAARIRHSGEDRPEACAKAATGQAGGHVWVTGSMFEGVTRIVAARIRTGGQE